MQVEQDSKTKTVNTSVIMSSSQLVVIFNAQNPFMESVGDTFLLFTDELQKK